MAATTRSLNEPVGLAVSSLSQRSPEAARTSPSAGAATSGVGGRSAAAAPSRGPAGRSTGRSTGRRAARSRCPQARQASNGGGVTGPIVGGGAVPCDIVAALRTFHRDQLRRRGPGRGQGGAAGLGVPPGAGRGRDGGPDRDRRTGGPRRGRGPRRRDPGPGRPLDRRHRRCRHRRPGPGSWPPATSPPSSGTSRARARPCGRPCWSATGELIVWCDADVRDFDPAFVTGLLGPLLTEPDIAFVKGYYERPETGGQPGGGRVTELLARPALALLHPALAGMVQPLSGEYAARRSLVEALPFVEGYGVDIGLLLDAEAAVGIARPGPGRPRGATAPQPEPGRAVGPGHRSAAHDPGPGRGRRPPGLGRARPSRGRPGPGPYGRATGPRGPSPPTSAAPPDGRLGRRAPQWAHEQLPTSSPSTAARRSSPAAPAGSAG